MVLCILSTLGSIYGIFVIAANKTLEENLGWQVDFAITMFQDLVLSPVLFVIVQLFVFKMTNSNVIKSKKAKSYIAAKFLDKNLGILYAKAMANQMNTVGPRTGSMKIKRSRRTLKLQESTTINENMKINGITDMSLNDQAFSPLQDNNTQTTELIS